VITDAAILVSNDIVHHTGYLPDLHYKPCFLQSLSPSSVLEPLAQFHCATGKGPETFRRLLAPPDEDDPVAIIDDCAYSDNGCMGIFAPHSLLLSKPPFEVSWSAHRFV
jgi:hypothetical protein